MSDMGQFCIYRRTGEFLTTLETEADHSWVLNDYGSCSFALSLSDDKAIRHYLDNGLRVYIRHDKLPPWGGVIDGDGQFGDGDVTMNAYGGEYLLKYRIVPDTDTWTDSSTGVMFTRYINYANAAEDLLVRAGSIWGGGTGVEQKLDSKSVYDHVKDMGKNRGYDWNFDAAVTDLGQNSKLYFYANFYEKRGETVNFWLEEGINLSGRARPLRIQGDIVNDVYGFGEAGDDDARPKGHALDRESIARHGLRQGSVNFSGVTEQATVQAKTEAHLKQKKFQRNTFSVEALNVGDTFNRLRLGNVLNLKMITAGFYSENDIRTLTQVRILGMRYKVKSDSVELTLDEVTA